MRIHPTLCWKPRLIALTIEISRFAKMNEVIVVTTPELPGYEIVKTLGTIYGLTVRTRGVGGIFVAGIENFRRSGDIVLSDLRRVSEH